MRLLYGPLESSFGVTIMVKNDHIEVLAMSFSEYDVSSQTRKGNFLIQIDQ